MVAGILALVPEMPRIWSRDYDAVVDDDDLSDTSSISSVQSIASLGGRRKGIWGALKRRIRSKKGQPILDRDSPPRFKDDLEGESPPPLHRRAPGRPLMLGGEKGSISSTPLTRGQSSDKSSDRAHSKYSPVTSNRAIWNTGEHAPFPADDDDDTEFNRWDRTRVSLERGTGRPGGRGHRPILRKTASLDETGSTNYSPLGRKKDKRDKGHGRSSSDGSSNIPEFRVFNDFSRNKDAVLEKDSKQPKLTEWQQKNVHHAKEVFTGGRSIRKSETFSGGFSNTQEPRRKEGGVFDRIPPTISEERRRGDNISAKVKVFEHSLKPPGQTTEGGSPVLPGPKLIEPGRSYLKPKEPSSSTGYNRQGTPVPQPRYVHLSGGRDTSVIKGSLMLTRHDSEDIRTSLLTIDRRKAPDEIVTIDRTQNPDGIVTIEKRRPPPLTRHGSIDEPVLPYERSLPSSIRKDVDSKPVISKKEDTPTKEPRRTELDLSESSRRQIKPYKRSFSSIARLAFLGSKSTDKDSSKGAEGNSETTGLSELLGKTPEIKVPPGTPAPKLKSMKPYRKSSSISFFSSMLKKGDDTPEERKTANDDDPADLISVPVTRKTSPLLPDPSLDDVEPITVKTVNGSIPGRGSQLPHTLPRARGQKTPHNSELNGLNSRAEKFSIPDLADEEFDEDDEDEEEEEEEEELDDTASMNEMLPPILRKRSKKGTPRMLPHRDGSIERRAHFREQVEVLQQDAEGNPLRMEVELKQGINFGHLRGNKEKAKKAKSLRHIFPSEDIVVIKQRNGKKKLRLVVHVGAGFSSDKIAVRALKGGKKLHVTAEKPEPLGDGTEYWREFTDKFVLPNKINPYRVRASFDINGDLCIEAPFADSLF